MDGKIIKKTQDTLGKIVKKPPLTDKLLSKPPFRFLHDIITSVVKSTGFMKGLYVEDEMKSDNVKDKDSKCAFLQKAVDMVSLVLGRTLSVKPSKVVAGHEPEKTNEFLQNLAEAVNKKVNNDDYVQRVLKGDKDAGSSSKKEKSKDRDKSSDRRKKDKDKVTTAGDEIIKDKDTEKEEKDKEREKRHKSRDRDRDRDDKKDRDKDKEHREKSRDREHKKDRRDKDKDDDKHKEKDRRKRKEKDEAEEGEREKSRDREKEREKRRKEREEEKAQEPAVNGEREDGGAAQQRIPRPSSAKGSRRRHGHDEEQHRAPKKEKQESSMNGTLGEEDLPPQVAAARKMARPSSARPAPPRVKKNDGLQEDAPMLGQSNVPNIITDKGDSSEDEDDGFMAKEEDLPAPDLTEPSRTAAHIDPEDADHGGLVKKMLKTKEELEGGSQTQQGQRKTEIERSSQVSDATRRKERETVQKEIDKLRSSIQTLTRSVNPLGKIMDFVQEDLDSMQKELEMWKKENKENAVKLKQEQSITESSIEPLKSHLTEIDASITDQLDLIAAVKSNIIKNDDRIEKMMGSVTKS